MRIVFIANNINRNVYMHQNTRIFPTTGYARLLLFIFIRRELGGMGTGCLFQFTNCDSVTGQTEDQQVSHQHCPPRVLIFEVGQPIINVKRFSPFLPNNYVMKHNSAILYQIYLHLSYDVASGSEITPCNKICKPLVVYRFTGNVITSITTLRT